MRKLALLLTLLLLPAGCPKEKKNTSATSASGKSFSLEVKPPPAGKVGAAFKAVVTLKPLGEYKVNMEYPLRLVVKGPQAASPQQQQLVAKDAKKMTKAGVVLEPTAKISAAGEHRFSAVFHFSLCTKNHCDLKHEKLQWVAKAD